MFIIIISIVLRPAAARWTFVTGGKHATSTLRKDDADDNHDDDVDHDEGDDGDSDDDNHDDDDDDDKKHNTAQPVSTFDQEKPEEQTFHFQMAGLTGSYNKN